MNDDIVRLELGGRSVLIAERYEVESGVFTQPSAFVIELGHAGVVRDLLRAYPPNTPFRLFVNDALQFEGRTDAPGASGSTSGSRVRIRGRDLLAPVHDGYVRADTSYTNKTSLELVEIALKEVGVEYGGILIDNAKSRKTRAGVPIVTLREPLVDKRRKTKPRQAKVGETWFEFLKRDLDHAGLFLWAGPDRTFVVSRPNPDQRPLYRIVRKEGRPKSVESYEFDNDTSKRFSEYMVFGRGGGKKFGSARTKGGFEDAEMQAFGFERLRTFRDVNVTSDEEASFYAARKIAETRRAGFRLHYTVAGLTVPAIGGAGRAVWTPDTVVEVDDDEIGLHGSFWIENVAFRAPPTTTTLRLMRPDDLVFGSDE